MTTDGENGDESQEDVSAFRVAIVAELGPRSDYRTGPETEPVAVALTRLGFNDVMSELLVGFAIDVDDPFDASAPKLRVDLRLPDLRAFRPDGLLEAAAPLRALAEAKRILEQAPRTQRGSAELRAHLARVLPRAEWAAVLAGESAAAPAQKASAPAAPAGVAAAPAAGESVLDALLDQVDVTAPAAAPAPSGGGGNDPVSALISAVAKSARPPAPGGASGKRAAANAPGVAAAMARLVHSILAHPEVHRLERLWRSARLVVEHADPKRGVEVYAIGAADHVAEATLDALAESGTGAFDLVVLGDELRATATDLARAKHAAAAGEAMRSPVLVSGTPELVGAADLESLGRSLRKLSSVDDPRAVAVRAAAQDEAMRWLFVALNGPLVRAPYDAETARARGIPVAQPHDDASSWIAALPAFALAALAAKSAAKSGWPTPVTAPSVMLEGLVVREAHDGGTTAALATEAYVSDDAARELAQAGLVAFGGVPNRDAVYVRAATSMFRPKGPVARAAEGSLADALLVGSLTRALAELSEAIPEGTPAAKIEEVVRVVIRDLFAVAPPPGPEIEAHYHEGQLTLRVRPHRFAGITLEELSLDIAMH